MNGELYERFSQAYEDEYRGVLDAPNKDAWLLAKWIAWACVTPGKQSRSYQELMQDLKEENEPELLGAICRGADYMDLLAQQQKNINTLADYLRELVPEMSEAEAENEARRILRAE